MIEFFEVCFSLGCNISSLEIHPPENLLAVPPGEPTEVPKSRPLGWENKYLEQNLAMPRDRNSQ